MPLKNIPMELPENIMKLVYYSPISKYKVISNGGANNLLTRTLDKLNIDRISMHGLRHTHVGVLLYKYVSVYYVSERLGHSDIETTLRTYTHVIEELRIKDEEKSNSIYERMLV